MSEQYPQDLLDLGYSEEIINEYDNDLLRTLDGLMPWEVPGAEYQGYGNPYEPWWGGGDIPMDDPRRAEAARALYEKTGQLYTPFSTSQPTLAKNIQDTVDYINKQGQFRFGDDWETYVFDPTKFAGISTKGDRGQADYSAYKQALSNDIQKYVQQYDPESLNWRDEAISNLTIDRYQNKGLTYADYAAKQQASDAARQATIDEAARLGISVNELRARRAAASQERRAQRELERQQQEAYRNSPQYEIDRQRELNNRVRAMFGIGPVPVNQTNAAQETNVQNQNQNQQGMLNGFVNQFRSGNMPSFGFQPQIQQPQQSTTSVEQNVQEQPNTMFGQTQASTGITQNNLLNELTNKIKSQRAAVLKNLFGM